MGNWSLQMTVPLERQKNIADVAPRVREQLGLGSAAVEDATSFATAEQGGKADTALQPDEFRAASVSVPLVLRTRDKINVLDYATSASQKLAVSQGNVAVDALWADAIQDSADQQASEITVDEGNYESSDNAVLLNPGRVVRGAGSGTVFRKNGAGQLFSTQQAPPSIADGELAADAGTGTAYLNSVQLATGEGAAFTVGQTCLLVSEEAITTAAGDKKAQIVTIQSIAGDLVRFWETLRYSFSVANTARLVPLTLASGVGYRDLRIIMDDTITLESSLGFHPNFGIDVQFAHDVIIDNVGVKGAVGSMISLRGVKGAVLERLTGSDGGSTTTGSDDPSSSEGAGGFAYGVSLSGLNQGILVNGGVFERIRHAFTTGGFYASIFNYGEPVSVSVNSLVAIGMKNAAFDTHQAGRDIAFNSCKASMGRFAGFQVRSMETRLHNCSASDMIGPAAWVRGGQSASPQTAGDRCQITDFTAERTNLGSVLGGDWTAFGAIMDEGEETLINGLSVYRSSGPAITVGRNGIAKRTRYKNIDAVDVCQSTINKAVVHVIDTNFDQTIDIDGLSSLSDGKVVDLIKIDSADPFVTIRGVRGSGHTGSRVSTVALGRLNDEDAPINPAVKEFSDDFIGRVLDASKWRTHKGSSSAAVLPDLFPAPEGKVRLTTGNDAGGTVPLNGSQLSAGTIVRADFGQITSRFRLYMSATTDVAVFVGFTDQSSVLEMPFTLGGGNALTANASNAVGVLFDTAADADNWWLVGVKNDVKATAQNIGSAPTAGLYEYWDIIIEMNGSAQFYRNGQKVGAVMVGAVQPNANLVPAVVAFSRGSASRNIDVDQIWHRQNR